MFEVVAIGSATRDTFVVADIKTIPWKNTPSRRAYVLPLGEKLEVKSVFFTIGGNAANAAVTFSRQGLGTACAAKIGCDVYGEELRRRLKEEGVDTRLMVCDQYLPTAYSVLLTRGGEPRRRAKLSVRGERTILGYHGASDSFRLQDIKLDNLKSRWWYLSLAGESDKMFSALLRFARKNNIAVAFNPSGHHLRHKRSEILSSLKDLSFLVLNEEEAALLTGIPFSNEKAVFKKLDRLVPGVLAVTNGRVGMTASDGRFVYKSGIFKERKLADRTGAGDAFGAGFVAGLIQRGLRRSNMKNIRQQDINYAIRLATANAAAAVEEVGATEGVLTEREFRSSPRFKNLKILIKKV